MNEDLLPFACIAGPCFQPPAFARRSDWIAHMQRYHGIFWRRVPTVQTSNNVRSLHYNTREISDAGPSEDICPLCCMSLVNSRGPATGKLASMMSSTSQTAAELLTLSPDSKDTIESRKKNTKNEADSDEKTASHLEEPAVDHMMSPMMNHIADHLQFLALLAVRLSARKITEGDEHSFSSSPALSSNQDSEKGSIWNDDSEYDEGDAPMEKDEHEFLAEIPPDLECPEDEWVETHLRNLGQEAEINSSTTDPQIYGRRGI